MYTTANLVQSELRSTVPFDSSTIPSLQDINSWIDQESALIDHDAGMSFASTTCTSVFDYNGVDYLILKASPVISVSSVLYATSELGKSDYGTSWVTKTEDLDYTMYNNEGTVYILSNWNPQVGAKRIKVIYESGYEDTPKEIELLATKKVALRVLKTLIHSNVNEGNDGGSISVGSIMIVEPAGISVNTVKELSNDIKELESKLTTGFGIYRFERI
jgi:hypothetical protein